MHTPHSRGALIPLTHLTHTLYLSYTNTPMPHFCLECEQKAGSKVEREAEQSGGNGNGAQLSGLAITPGTRFMADITLSLTAWWV